MAPSVSSVTGTISTGSTIQISGSGFGTKSRAKAWLYADFQEGLLAPHSTLSFKTAFDATENRVVSSSSADKRWGNGYACKGTTPGGSAGGRSSTLSTVLSGFTAGEKCRIAFTRRWKNPDTSGNWKWLRIWKNSFQYPNAYFGTPSIPGGERGWYLEDLGNTNNVTRKYFSVNPPSNTYRWEEFLLKHNTLGGTADGSLKILFDHVEATSDDTFAFDYAGKSGPITQLFIQDTKASADWASGMESWIQDVYVDDSWHAVVLGNASTYDACTIREFLPITAHSSTSITAQVRLGTSTSSVLKYLFVLDGDNVANTSGYDVSGSGGEVTPAPTVTSVAPDELSLLGGGIVITGTGFSASINDVRVGTTSCTNIVRDSATQITCTAPEKAEGSYNLVVENSDGQSGTLGNGLTYVPDPTNFSDTFTEASTINLGSHTSDSGHSWSGTDTTNSTLQVNATDDAAQTIGTTTNNFAVLNATPASADYHVECTGKTGATGSSDRFGVVARWDVASSNGYMLRVLGTGVLSLNSVTGGSTTELGTYTIPSFSAATNYTIRLTVSGTTIEGSVAGVTQISVTNSAYSSVGKPGITLRSNGNSPRITSFSTSWDPGVTACSASQGPVAGGTNVTLTGFNFTSSITSVTFGGTAATNVVRVSSTSITCTTPAKAAGSYDIVVTNSDARTGTLTNGFTYLAAPTASSVDVASGPTVGGTTVLVTGAFPAGITGATVGGVAATAVSKLDGATVTLTTPAGTLGAKDIVITDEYNQTGTLVGGFTYADPAPGSNAGMLACLFGFGK